MEYTRGNSMKQPSPEAHAQPSQQCHLQSYLCVHLMRCFTSWQLCFRIPPHLFCVLLALLFDMTVGAPGRSSSSSCPS